MKNKKSLTIVGGERKWYESTVEQLGYELVHCCGERPDRILCDLRRSTYMFLMLESVSHNATKRCVECAKKYGIPFKRFKGSRSQLERMIQQLN